MPTEKFQKPVKKSKKSTLVKSSLHKALEETLGHEIALTGQQSYKSSAYKIVDFGGPPPKKKVTSKHQPKALKMSATETTENASPSMVIGRTHNPFTGVKEITVYPPEGELAQKVTEELNKAKSPIEIEASPQTMTLRPLRRTAQAAVKIALDMVDSGAITAAQALNSVPISQINKLMTASIADFKGLTKLGSGLAAAPGIAIGKIATNAKEAIAMANKGERVILKVSHTTPEDMDALKAVVGIIAETGGYTSHSAVVARQMGKPCIVSYAATGPESGTTVTIDGGTGSLWSGEAVITDTGVSAETKRFIDLAKSISSMKVYANADTKEDVLKAIELGAEGVGLCRTEHTFFTADGIKAIRRVILSAKNDQEMALYHLQTVQRTHFKEFFKALGSLPATIRLLDPPMHEFLPAADDKEAIKALAKDMKVSQAALVERINGLKESNPMLGHRGCRLGLTFKGLYKQQVMAIMLGAYDSIANAYEKTPRDIGIMIPLIVNMEETKSLIGEIREAIQSVWAEIGGSYKKYLNVTVGSMLETPRACLITYDMAELCDFFSFGTNDLTQTTWALSRDDAKWMVDYQTRGIVDCDPFQSLDTEGVGQLMDHAIAALKDRRSKVKIGICGEHGGDPESIAFCNKLKLDYVSCSPSRITTAKLASALANIVGQVSPEIETQQIELEPIVNLVKTEPPKVVKPKAESNVSTKVNFPKGTNFAALNQILGTWKTPSIPTTNLAWKPLDKVSQEEIDQSPGIWYVKYHPLVASEGKHVIGWTDKSNLMTEQAIPVWTNKPVNVNPDEVCAVAAITDSEALSLIMTKLSSMTKAKITEKVNPFDDLAQKIGEGIAAALTDKEKAALIHGEAKAVEATAEKPSLAVLKQMKIEDMAGALKGMVVKTTDGLWCKVIGYAPNPYQTTALAVLLPKNGGTTTSYNGPMKPFLKLNEGEKIEGPWAQKLKYLNLEKITDVSSDLSLWQA